MKTKFRLFAIVAMLLVLPVSLTFASFPVKQNNNELKASEKVVINKENAQQKAEQLSENAGAEISKANPVSKKAAADEKLILILLWFFLGIFAAHRWYKGKPVGWNILFILTLGGCGVWAIIDLINIITDKF
jgi:TM2 domain-containing membrane protein YozV